MGHDEASVGGEVSMGTRLVQGTRLAWDEASMGRGWPGGETSKGRG